MNKIDILKPTIFPKEITAGITLANKDSYPPYGFCIFPGKILTDSEVESHRSDLGDLLKVPRKNMIFQKQVHTDGIKEVSFGEAITQSDGMISNQKEIVLNVTVADCCGILIYDKVSKAIGALHSGWKGTSLNIAAKGVKLLNEKYDSKAKDLLVWLSPCAGKEKYEVEWDVAKFFEKHVTKLNDKKYLLDIREPILEQLIDAGIPENQIEVNHDCTIEDDRFHSYRRDKEQSGRMSVFIKIGK